jgi:hypothetical protein
MGRAGAAPVAVADPTYFFPASSTAERAGFEPAIPFRVYTLSRRAPSTTRTPLQYNLNYDQLAGANSGAQRNQ